ncbi:MAG: DedA family protein [Thermoleophilia bacterium]
MCIFYPSDDCRALFDIMLMYQHPTARRLPIGYIESITPQLGNWGYLLVFVMTFLETSAFVGLVVPGEVTLLLAGLLASQGYFDLSALIALASAGAILGDSTGYAIGRYGGIKFLRRFGRFFFFRESYLETAERYFPDFRTPLKNGHPYAYEQANYFASGVPLLKWAHVCAQKAKQKRLSQRPDNRQARRLPGFLDRRFHQRPGESKATGCPGLGCHKKQQWPPSKAV